MPEGTALSANTGVALSNCRFRKVDRIIRRPDFVRIQRTGLRYKTGRMTVTWLPAATDRTRLGVTVSKKVGNSPIRSLVKRWIREVFRTHKDRWPEMVDFVVIARPSVVRGGLDGVRKDMLRWADKLARAKPPADEQ